MTNDIHIYHMNSQECIDNKLFSHMLFIVETKREYREDFEFFLYYWGPNGGKSTRQGFFAGML